MNKKREPDEASRQRADQRAIAEARSRAMVERDRRHLPMDSAVGLVGAKIYGGDWIGSLTKRMAARLEALADPGGIMVSSVVHDQVRDKLSFGFEDMSRTSRVRSASTASPSPKASRRPRSNPPRLYSHRLPTGVNRRIAIRQHEW